MERAQAFAGAHVQRAVLLGFAAAERHPLGRQNGGDANAKARVYTYMRYAALFAFGLLAIPVNRTHAQSGWISAEVGFAPYGATSPYSSGLAGIGRVGLGVRVTDGALVELEGHGFGALLTGDVYSPNARALPNTSGISLSVVRFTSRSERLSLSAGAGLYSVAPRRETGGGDGIGFHAGATTVLTRRGRIAFTLGLRTLLLPDIGDSRIWVVPITAGIRVR